MYENACIHSAFTPQTRKHKPHLSANCYSLRELSRHQVNRRHNAFLTMRQHNEHKRSINVHVKGEPGRPAGLHACLHWVCAVKGVGALMTGEAQAQAQTRHLCWNGPTLWLSLNSLEGFFQPGPTSYIKSQLTREYLTFMLI